MLFPGYNSYDTFGLQVSICSNVLLLRGKKKSQFVGLYLNRISQSVSIVLKKDLKFSWNQQGHKNIFPCDYSFEGH